jgi:hypothetical protein
MPSAILIWLTSDERRARPQSAINIGFVIFPDLTQLDFTGPQQVLARLPGSAMHSVAKSADPVPSESGLGLVPPTSAQRPTEIGKSRPTRLSASQPRHGPQTAAAARRYWNRGRQRYCLFWCDIAPPCASPPTAPPTGGAHPRKTAASRPRKANSRERRVRT